MSLPTAVSSHDQCSVFSDRMFQRVCLCMLGCGLTLGVITAASFGIRAGSGVLIGTAIALANLVAFGLIGYGLMESRSRGWLLVALVKTTLLFGSIGWLLRLDARYIAPFVVGYLSLPLGITLSHLFKQADENHPKS